jgi:hypothetical protein
MGSTPHPLPTEPLRDVRSVKTGVLGGDKGVDGERSPARASSPGLNPRTGHRRGGLLREGTRSRLLHRSFARRWGKRGLGRTERLRGPLPVLESAGRRRRVLGRTDVSGAAATLSLLGTSTTRPPPRCAGCGARLGGWSFVARRAAARRRGSGFADVSAGREMLQKSSGDVGIRISRGKHRGEQMRPSPEGGTTARWPNSPSEGTA